MARTVKPHALSDQKVIGGWRPGSGKSTFCERLLRHSPLAWMRVNQDTIADGRLARCYPTLLPYPAIRPYCSRAPAAHSREQASHTSCVRAGRWVECGGGSKVIEHGSQLHTKSGTAEREPLASLFFMPQSLAASCVVWSPAVCKQGIMGRPVQQCMRQCMQRFCSMLRLLRQGEVREESFAEPLS